MCDTEIFTSFFIFELNISIPTNDFCEANSDAGENSVSWRIASVDPIPIGSGIE